MFRKQSNIKLKHSRKLFFILLIPSFIFLSVVHSVASTRVCLEWQPNSEADLEGYRVFSREEGKPYDYRSPNWEGTINYCTIYNMDDTKDCYFVVRAFNAKGIESSNSNEVLLKATPNSVNQRPSNLPPSIPNILYPEIGQNEIEIPLDITTDSFSDPNNDFHSRSQWQISEHSDFSTCVVDVTGNKHLTTFSVPHMVLKSNHKYYVRVRFFDNYFAASNWSDAVEFTTAYLIEDLNLNGISDAEEVDDTVDFNLDGIPDNFQPQIIKCVKSHDGSVYIGIEKASNSVDEIESLEMIDPDTIFDTVNRPSDLIFGLFSYRLRVNKPGDVAKVKIYFSGEIFGSDEIYKYDTINGWYDYSEHTTFNDDGQSITLEVKDGGYGDSDGLANGVIVDPGGVASGGGGFDSSTDETTGGVSGGSGCFIATAAFGSKYENHVQLLRRFRDLYLLPNRIGRAFVKTYYKYSPSMADFISRHDALRKVVRFSLIPLLGISWLLLHFGMTPILPMMFLLGFMAIYCYRKRTTT
jgi:hypothetical protein